jgi:ABC-2 type transport system permease protein
MRSILIDGVYRADLMLIAVALDGVYLAIGSLVFITMFERARRDGQLLQTGE